MTYTLRSENDLRDLAEKLISFIVERPNNETAVVVLLSGPLGAGKTSFTQSLGVLLGVKEIINSPTFVVMKSYPIFETEKTGGRYAQLVHMDAYRLESVAQLEVLHFDEMVADTKNIIVIEWPEKIAGVFPDDAIILSFAHHDETTRIVTADFITE